MPAMNDLPTRDEINTEYRYSYSRTDIETRRFNALRDLLFLGYVDGVLMTREELIDSLDYSDLEDRLVRHCLDVGAASTCTLRQVEDWIAAALGEDTE